MFTMTNLLPGTKVYGGRLKDRKKLYDSSSGGAFTAISDVFLTNDDAVVCASYNYLLHQQEYQIIYGVEERNAACGSKYMQSIPGDIFQKAETWLRENPEKRLLFVGMGCQAAGFKSYIDMKGLRERVTIVDIICHGSPSPRIWREYAEYLEQSYGKIEYVSFKDKRKGWKVPTAFVKINCKEFSIQPYVKIFYNRKALRLSCHKCPYTTTERTTDITIGDFWHIEDKIPEQYDKFGTSLFIIHTDKGLCIFESAKQSLTWFETNCRDCWQLNLEKPTPIAENRSEFWKDYNRGGIEYIIRKYGKETIKSRVKIRIIKYLRKIFG